MNTVNAENRGYLKIKGATDAFNFDFKDKIVLDIGSSTGGFTEFALNSGAKKVIAVEKGSHQMKAPLRFDPRIELHEKTDIFNVGTQDNSFSGISEHLQNKSNTTGDAHEGTKTIPSSGHPQLLRGRSEEPREDGRDERPEEGIVFVAIPDVIVADVSFISLKPILIHAKKHLSDSHTDFLVMLKPQFEAKPYELNQGIVKNEKIRREIIKNFESWLKQNGFLIIKKHDNALHGKHGNTERFYWLNQISR